MALVIKGETLTKKPITDSPGYYITPNGEVYNEHNKRMKTWYSTDGYERVRLTSTKHNRRVNKTVHLMVAIHFLNDGKPIPDKLQVNHIDGIKANNDVSNLELITGTANVNHAHNNALYTFDLPVTVRDILNGEITVYRSLREASRELKVSMNFIRPRVIISNKFPMLNRYVLNIDYKYYLEHVSKIKNNKTIYVYSHVSNKYYVLTSYVQISVLFGISYINVGRLLLRKPELQYYTGGYTFSLLKLDKLNICISKEMALCDRENVWKKLAMCT